MKHVIVAIWAAAILIRFTDGGSAPWRQVAYVLLSLVVVVLALIDCM